MGRTPPTGIDDTPPLMAVPTLPLVAGAAPLALIFHLGRDDTKSSTSMARTSSPLTAVRRAFSSTSTGASTRPVRAGRSTKIDPSHSFQPSPMGNGFRCASWWRSRPPNRPSSVSSAARRGVVDEVPIRYWLYQAVGWKLKRKRQGPRSKATTLSLGMQTMSFSEGAAIHWSLLSQRNKHASKNSKFLNLRSLLSARSHRRRACECDHPLPARGMSIHSGWPNSLPMKVMYPSPPSPQPNRRIILCRARPRAAPSLGSKTPMLLYMAEPISTWASVASPRW
mmetsp:Transcript_7787/g.19146  ORF Transcript_7787/g.19146 Transcript_7787/m.19146 type:complete len:281 (-) Transcript_7787:2392-3234(-)